ncbi:hypothetical protein ONR75_15835 [Rhodopseudomonas sp. P2A-2r]|uniref:hypothetical protein n=1 Tax=Rhodopseudomonas sp. P2A-2r TaxID=2991972 RepID=UPI0022344E28|nr:hypothetical protein [Rhodopseudomonas sp. P2A-2r]UZE51901.1 hypothetical protein ONR75_15835 [Rhodopseudomonas sp. P2A-2r]
MTDYLTLIRQQFAQLCAQRDAILVQSMPIREARDALAVAAAADLAAKTDPMNAQIIALEAPLADLMSQIAQISNALSGQTGSGA